MTEKISLERENYEDLLKKSKYGYLIGGMIHNLNTPLMGISGRLELLEMKYPDIKGLSQISQQVEHITKMLQAIAYLADKDNNDRTMEIDLSDFLEKIDILMTTDMSYKHKINVEKEFVSHKIQTNVSLLFNIVYRLIQYLLQFAEQEDTLYFKNSDVKLEMTLIKEEDNPDFDADFDEFSRLFQYELDRLLVMSMKIAVEFSSDRLSFIISL